MLFMGGNILNIFEDVQGKGRIINVADELLGKEVIDGSGKLVGRIKDVLWDFKSNRIESLLVEEQSGSFLSRMRSSEKQSIPYTRIHSIGDKILVDAEFDEYGYSLSLDTI